MSVSPEHRASAARILQEPFYQAMKERRTKNILSALMSAETDEDRLRVQADHRATEAFFQGIESAAKVRSTDE